MPDVILGFGANLGDPVAQITEALRRLASRGVVPVAISSAYLSDAVGGPEQPAYINAAAVVETSLEPRELLDAAMQVEAELGRVRSERDAPRTIDIDLIAYGDRVIDEPGLMVPHPRMAARAFVLIPLAEIAPEWRHPVTRRTAPEMIAAAPALERISRIGSFDLGQISGRGAIDRKPSAS